MIENGAQVLHPAIRSIKYTIAPVVRATGGDLMLLQRRTEGLCGEQDSSRTRSAVTHQPKSEVKLSRASAIRIFNRGRFLNDRREIRQMRAIYRLLRLHAASAPQKPAVILPDRFISYEMIWRGILSVQAAAAELRLDLDRPVGILIDNPARHLIVWLALMKSGFTTASVRHEHFDFVKNAGFQSLFTDQRIPVLPGLPAHFVDEKWFTSSGSDVEVSFAANRIARIAFTSGSTGRPKAIAISADAVHKRVMGQWMVGLGRGRSPRTLAMYSMSSLPFDLLRVLMAGNSLVFSPQETVLQTMLATAVDEVFCSAAQARALVQMQNALRLPLRISLFSLGGGILTPQAADDIQRTFLCNLHNTYASTEATYAGVAYGELLSRRRERGNCFVRVADVEVVDESGNLKPIGEEGRIRVRSEAMAWPFTGSLVEADDVKGDGWFYPGDLGRIDGDGLLIVSGRIDEVLNTGGVKYTPEVFEEALRQHPKVRDAAIVRVGDGRGGQEPWLAVVATASVTLPELNRWLEGRFVGELGSVQMARLFAVDEIPSAGAGKVARDQLRKLLLAMAERKQ